MAGDLRKPSKTRNVIHVDFAKRAVQQLPWLDERGFPLPDKDLKRVSKRWSPETWNAYLESLEVSLKENVGFSEDRAVLLTKFENSEDGLEASTRDLVEFEPDRDDLSDRAMSVTSLVEVTERQEEPEPVEEVRPKDEDGIVQIALSASEQVVEFDLYAEVEAAMSELTENESLVIWRLFWEGESEREIAVIMRRSRRSVRVWKDRAFSKLKPILSPIFLIYEGESVPRDPTKSQKIPSPLSNEPKSK